MEPIVVPGDRIALDDHERLGVVGEEHTQLDLANVCTERSGSIDVLPMDAFGVIDELHVLQAQSLSVTIIQWLDPQTGHFRCAFPIKGIVRWSFVQELLHVMHILSWLIPVVHSVTYHPPVECKIKD